MKTIRQFMALVLLIVGVLVVVSIKDGNSPLKWLAPNAERDRPHVEFDENRITRARPTSPGVIRLEVSWTPKIRDDRNPVAIDWNVNWEYNGKVKSTCCFVEDFAWDQKSPVKLNAQQAQEWVSRENGDRTYLSCGIYWKGVLMDDDEEEGAGSVHCVLKP